jgi:hypothetical protein
VVAQDRRGLLGAEHARVAEAPGPPAIKRSSGERDMGARRVRCHLADLSAFGWLFPFSCKQV